MNVIKDIRSGALPLSELPRYALWLAGRMFWIWYGILIIALFAAAFALSSRTLLPHPPPATPTIPQMRTF